jgi:lysozyme
MGVFIMAKITKVSKTGLELIKKYEGFRANPYKCPAGVPTIGYGATYYPDGKRVKMTDAPVTEKQATEMLKTMLVGFEKAVDTYCIDTINQNQFDALVSFAYNVGTNALKNSTLLKKLNVNANDPTIRDEFKKWVKAGGKTLKGLVTRRNEEADIYFS